jgi:hypothetical protein
MTAATLNEGSHTGWAEGEVRRFVPGTIGSPALRSCVALSVAMHVLLLSQLVQSPREATLAGAQQPSLSGRLIATPSQPAAAPPVLVPSPTSAAPAPVRREIAARPERATRADPPPNSQAQSHASPEAPTPSESTAPADDGYIPRPLLTQGPVALTTVLIESPASQAPSGRYMGVLSLFIDEEGRVREVRGEQPSLPPEMEEAARAAFLQARFKPGELDGRIVRSRLRVEVSFDQEVRLP